MGLLGAKVQADFERGQVLGGEAHLVVVSSFLPQHFVSVPFGSIQKKSLVQRYEERAVDAYSVCKCCRLDLIQPKADLPNM